MRRPSQVLAAVIAGGFAVLAATAVVVVLAPESGAQTADPVIALQNNTFSPKSLPLEHSGMTVHFVHKDGQTPHSITFDAPVGSPGYFDYPGAQCQPGSDNGAAVADECYQEGDNNGFVPVTFNSGGTFKFHCKIHPAMTGEVVVAGAPAQGSTSSTAPKTTTTKKTTDTTVGSLTTTSEVDSTTSSSTVESSTTSTLGLTTQTTAPGTALGTTSSNDDDEPSGVLKAAGVILLAAVAIALIPAWRRLT